MRKYCCDKVMFSQVSVNLFTGGDDGYLWSHFLSSGWVCLVSGYVQGGVGMSRGWVCPGGWGWLCLRDEYPSPSDMRSEGEWVECFLVDVADINIVNFLKQF